MDENINSVNFLKGTKENFSKIIDKDFNTLYFCEDTGEIFLGEDLYSHNDIKVYYTLDSAKNDGFDDFRTWSTKPLYDIYYIVDENAFYIRNGVTFLKVYGAVQPDLSLTFDDGNPAFVKNVPWRSEYKLNNTPLGVSQSIVYGDLTNNTNAYYNQQLGAEYEIKVPDTTKNLCGNPIYVGDLYQITLNNVPIKCRLIFVNNQLYLAECDNRDLPLAWAEAESFVVVPGMGMIGSMYLPMCITRHFYVIFEPHRIDKLLIPGEKVKGHFEIKGLGTNFSKFNLSVPEPKTFTFTPIWEKAPELNTDKAYKITFDAGEGNIIAGYNTSTITFTINNGDKYKDILKRLPVAYRPAKADGHDVTLWSFNSWYCDKYDFTLTEGDIENDGYFAAYEDVTFNAQWNLDYEDCGDDETYYYTYERSNNGIGSNTLRFECEGAYTSEDDDVLYISGEFFEEETSTNPVEICCDCGDIYSSVVRKCIMRHFIEDNYSYQWASWAQSPILLTDGYIHTGWYCEEFKYTLSLDDYLAYGNTAYWNIKKYNETKNTMSPEMLPSIDWNASKEGGDGYYIHNRPFGTNYARESLITSFPGLSWGGCNLAYHCSDRMISSYQTDQGNWTGDITSFCEENTLFDSVQFTVQSRSWSDTSGAWRYYNPKPMNLGRVYCGIIDGSLYVCDKEIVGGVIPDDYKLLFKISEDEDSANYWEFNIEYLDYKFLEDWFDENSDMPEDFPQLLDGVSRYITITGLQGYKVRTSVDKIDPKYLPEYVDLSKIVQYIYPGTNLKELPDGGYFAKVGKYNFDNIVNISLEGYINIRRFDNGIVTYILSTDYESHTLHTFTESEDTYTHTSKLYPHDITSNNAELVAECNTYCDNKINSLGTVFSFRGNIAFSALSSYYMMVGVAGVCAPGYVYNITDEFTADEMFVEDAVGKTYPAGTNVVLVKLDDGYKFDVLSGAIDLSNFYNKDEIDTKIAEQIANISNPDWNAQEGEDGYIENKPFGNEIVNSSAFYANLTDGVSAHPADLTSPNSYWVGYELDDEGNVARECKLNSTILDGKVYLTYTYGIAPNSWPYQFCAIVDDKTLTIIEHEGNGWWINAVAQKYYSQLDTKYLALDWEANEGEKGYLHNKPFGHTVIEEDITLFHANSYDLNNGNRNKYFDGTIMIDTNNSIASISCNSEYNTYPFCINPLCDNDKYFELKMELPSSFWGMPPVTIPIDTVQFKCSDEDGKYIFSSNWDEGESASTYGNIRRVQPMPSHQTHPYEWYLTFDNVDVNYFIDIATNSEYSEYFTDNGDGTYSLSFCSIYATMKCDKLKKIDRKYLPYEEFTEEEITSLVDELLTDE